MFPFPARCVCTLMVRGLPVALLVVVVGLSEGTAEAGASRAVSASGLSVFRSDAPASVELRSGLLVAVLHLEPWHLELRDRSTNRLLAREYPAEPRGEHSRPVGALGFVVRDSTRGTKPRWYRIASVLHLTAERDHVRVLAASDDPSGSQIEIGIRFPSPTSMTLDIAPRPSRGVLEVAEGFQSQPGEHYFGLGARFGPLDARGSEVRVRVQGELDTIRPAGNHLPVPFFASSRAYGVAVHGTEESVFQLNTVRPDAVIFKVIGPRLSFTVLTGPTPLDVVSQHAKTIGPPALPPLWAFGVWKTVIGGEERVLAEAERLQRERIPVTVLWSYDMLDERRQLGWRPWVYRRVRPGAYPDLPGLIGRLRARGYRVLGYVSPEFRTDSPLFSVGAGHGFYIRDRSGRPYVKRGMQGHPVALLDFTNPQAVHWWHWLMASVLTELGLDGWMQDGGDDAPGDGVYFSGVRGTAARNSYPVAYAFATHTAATRVRPEFVSFMRAGFAGSQRYTPLTWPCDNGFSWSRRDGLPAALRAALSGSISGFPFWAPDIGGYYGCGEGGSADEELWIRWVELGALHPVMRDHLGSKCETAIDLWSTPATVASFRRYAILHQRLVPYIHRLAVEAVQSGRPLMRSVALVSPDDPRAYHDEFTYLLGDDLLVAPVVEPGPKHRQVFLPEGDWIDWWQGGRYRGPAIVTVAAPLDRIPLFVRAGATHLLTVSADPTIRERDEGRSGARSSPERSQEPTAVSHVGARNIPSP